jgi:hypothetical protein
VIIVVVAVRIAGEAITNIEIIFLKDIVKVCKKSQQDRDYSITEQGI